LADIPGRVDEVRLGEAPSLDVEFHAGIAVFSVVWTTYSVAARALPKQTTFTVIFGGDSQSCLQSKTILNGFEVVVVVVDVNLQALGFAVFGLVELVDVLDQVLFGFGLVLGGSVFGEVCLLKGHFAKFAVNFFFWAFVQVVVHLPEFYLGLAE
jgi:hypothetical protein